MRSRRNIWRDVKVGEDEQHVMQSRSIRRSGQPISASASLGMRANDRDPIRGGHYGQRFMPTALTGRTHGCTDQRRDVKF